MKKTGNGLKVWQALEPAPELLEIQDLMPISGDDKERLKKDIQKNGFRDPLKIYQKGTRHFIIGGLNRWKIAQELGHTEPLPVDIYQGTAREYRELAIQDNLNRRHLTTKQKENILREFFKIDPERSSRQAAEKVGVHHSTASKVKKDMVRRGEISHVSQVTDTVGRRQPTAKKPRKSPVAPETAPPPDPDQLTVEQYLEGRTPRLDAPQNAQEAPHGTLKDLGGVEVGVYFNPYEISILEKIIIQAIKNEYSTPATKKALEAIRRKLAQARAGRERE